MSDQESPHEGDFVQVATADTPTEAHMLQGVLSSAGLSPRVADAEVVRMWSVMTPALGGVRVYVPASEEAAAREALADYAAGKLVLPGESIERPEFQTLPAPVFNPDRATLLSFVLTPVFAVAVQIVNASVIDQGAKPRAPWVWLVVLAAATVACVAALMAMNPGPFIIFRSGLVLVPLTCFWYICSGQAQTRRLLSTYGPRYRKRPLLPAAVAAAAAAMVLGLGVDALA